MGISGSLVGDRYLFWFSIQFVDLHRMSDRGNIGEPCAEDLI